MVKFKNSAGAAAGYLLTILIMIGIGLAAVAATYIWQHNKVTSLNNQIASQNSQIASLNNQISSLNGQVTKTCQGPQAAGGANCSQYTYTSPKGVSILVFEPAKNSTLSSPVAVIGEVPGNWSSEAQFPVQLKDSNGNVIAKATANVLGNWQTSRLVPFSAQLTYSTSPSGSGTILLQKDNPSGLSQNADSVSIPIKF